MSYTGDPRQGRALNPEEATDARWLEDRDGSMLSRAEPVSAGDRIGGLDYLRGFAVLGILLMNIVGMGMYGAAYIDPTIIGGAGGVNLVIWMAMHILADGKMRCLFSMIFGASIVLLTERLQSRKEVADIYYRRMLWLLVFGIGHAYLLWYGDILYSYALCGLALFPFRNLRPKTLIAIGAILLIVDSAAYLGWAHGLKGIIRNGIAAEQARLAGKPLTPSQHEDETQYEQWRHIVRPTDAELREDAEQWRGNLFHVLGVRAKIVFTYLHSQPYYSQSNLDIWCMMFFGMGLFKLDVLTGRRSARFYRTLLIAGYGIGLPINILTSWIIVRSHFDPVVYSAWNALLDPGRLLVATGHLSAIMVLYRRSRWRSFLRPLGGIGRTALSNYVLQSLITTVIFTGCGFRLYDRLERYQLYGVVLLIWIVEIAASVIWLRHFRFGPLEWCWRSLTYWRRQPMRVIPANG